MAACLEIALTAFFVFLLWPQGIFSQDVSIASPTPGTTLTAGQKLNIVLKIQTTTSSVDHIAFSAGFKTTKVSDPTSLGRPYVGSVFTHEGNDVVFDSGKLTYSFMITVPAPSNFTDGLPGSYNLTVADYYLSGATFTPIVKLSGVQVNVQPGNGSLSDSSSTQGENAGSGSTGHSPTGDATTPAKGGAQHLYQPLFAIFTVLGSWGTSLVF